MKVKQSIIMWILYIIAVSVWLSMQIPYFWINALIFLLLIGTAGALYMHTDFKAIENNKYIKKILDD